MRRKSPQHSEYDHYAVLGVPRTASEREIIRAYRHLALQTHPDRTGGDPQAESRYREINEAYQVLKDPERRALYDRAFAPVTSVLELFLNRPAGRKVMEVMLPSAPAAPCRGLPSLAVVTISPLRLRTGGVVDVKLVHQERPVALHISPGDDGPRWCRLAHLGHPGRNGGPSGDAWILVRPGPEET